MSIVVANETNGTLSAGFVITPDGVVLSSRRFHDGMGLEVPNVKGPNQIDRFTIITGSVLSTGAMSNAFTRTLAINTGVGPFIDTVLVDLAFDDRQGIDQTGPGFERNR